jgi:uncharacterized membrane protein/protein-disulfide isomerase
MLDVVRLPGYNLTGMSRTAASIALVCALTGLLAAGAAAYVHYRLLSDPAYLSFCDINATMSCTQVYASRYGSVAGVSVAVFGAIWFAGATLLAVAGLVSPPAVREDIPTYLFGASTIGLAVVLYLGYASFVVLQTVCILCLITYAAVIGLFIVSGAVASVPMMSLPRRALSDLSVLAKSPLALALTLLLVGGAASTLAFFPREGELVASSEPPVVTAEGQSDLERMMASAPREALPVSADGAKVLIVKFHDFQCPACGKAYLAYEPIFAKYAASHPGAVRVAALDFPLESECNSAVTTMLHPAACEAAVAVRLAKAQGRAEELEDWFFRNQHAMTPETVKQAARTVGEVTDFDARYDATLEGVRADVRLGLELGVNSTPTYYINGVKFEGAMAPQYFDQAIAYELAHAAQ